MGKESAGLLCAEWIRSYFRKSAALSALLAALYLVGYRLCSLKVWHTYDLYYAQLKWLKEHWGSIFWFLMFCLSALLTCFTFYQIAMGIQAVTQAVKQLRTDGEEEISLPEQFAHLEYLLNRSRIDHRADMQAAYEANQRKNDMIMYMAHDLKTPLTSMIGYLTLVCQEPDIPQHTRETYAGIALKKSLHLEDLINEFFDIARFNFSHMILKKSRIDLSVMLRQMISEFEVPFRSKNLSPDVKIEERAEISCDVEKIERVLDNLLKNIVNYSYENTVIRIRMSRTDETGIRLVTENRGKTIPKEMLDHIFEQFFRMDSSRSTNTGGSGLGLAAAKEIVKLHGGSIVCESKEEWIRFVVTLPSGE